MARHAPRRQTRTLSSLPVLPSLIESPPEGRRMPRENQHTGQREKLFGQEPEVRAQRRPTVTAALTVRQG
jgi:hypothetical protein